MSESSTPITDPRYLELVPHKYFHDPETEMHMPADQLRDGMIVLICFQGRVDERNENVSREELLVKNRWCLVTEQRFEKHDIHLPGLFGEVHFVGVYADGSKVERSCDQQISWIVKRRLRTSN